jgi:hypothetical protein
MPLIRSAKYKERISLALAIEQFGIVMQSCSYCKHNSCLCILLKENSSRCSECVCHGNRYDVASPSLGDL